MTGVWIILSTRWSFANVLVTMNVVISVIGTISIWALSRLWWQRGMKRALVRSNVVSLWSASTLTGTGEEWDLMTLLHNQPFLRQNCYLLFQLVVVITITLATMLAGPLARISLRSGSIIQPTQVNVLQTSKGAGPFANLLFGNVLWNSTIESMNKAGFPFDQLMDVVPPPNDPWVYVEREWDPTWRANCNFTEETLIHDLIATGNATFDFPLQAFPVLRTTMDSSWLNESLYRVNSYWTSWPNYTTTPEVEEFVCFMLIQTDPQLENQMILNQNPLRLSITEIHIQDIALQYKINSVENNPPKGPAGNASYTRAECLITRKEHIEDKDRIPWLWTNFTSSIVTAFGTYYYSDFAGSARLKQKVNILSGRELFRFYQAYIASVSTQDSQASPMSLSIRLPTVEVSAITLALVLLIFIITIWNLVSLLILKQPYKSEMSEIYIPDGKIEWMIHAAKSWQPTSGEKPKSSDQDHIQSAVFGSSKMVQQPSDMARVYSSQLSPTTDQIINIKTADTPEIGIRNGEMNSDSPQNDASPDRSLISIPGMGTRQPSASANGIESTDTSNTYSGHSKIVTITWNCVSQPVFNMLILSS
jgi:hypothetical protein